MDKPLTLFGHRQQLHIESDETTLANINNKGSTGSF
jgi:hypothetical protein